MTNHWKEIVPVDLYIVRVNGLLHEYDRKVLTMLYQPLIGSICYSLYMTLWSEMDADQMVSNGNKHHHLMRMMQLNLKQIVDERKKLEGIGLLKTYVDEDESTRTYIYELQPPLSPHDFFHDGVLNIYLYNRLGKTSFNRVKQFFSGPRIDSHLYTEVTSSFNDVFSSLSPSELQTTHSEMSEALKIDEMDQYFQREQPTEILISEEQFDFSLFFAGISESLIPRAAFTADVKEVIAKLSFVYQIDPIEMKKVVIQALDEQDEINIEALRKAARDYYQLQNGDVLPKLVNKVQPIQYRTMTMINPKNKEEQLIKQLEELSPFQFLMQLSGGVEPAVSDLKVIENVMINQKLNPGVINVLIHYVMLRSDMKLSKNYIDKLAGHWVRKKITTVKEAMQLAKDENRQYQEWAKEKKKTTKSTNQRTKRDTMNPEMKRRLLMLGTEDSTDEIIANEMTEEDRQKRKQKMLDLLDGKGD